MPAWAPSISCPFIRRLIVLLSEEEEADAPYQQDALLFTRLMELEMDAEKRDAAEASCRVIGRVRRIAGAAAVKGSPPVIRGR